MLALPLFTPTARPLQRRNHHYQPPYSLPPLTPSALIWLLRALSLTPAQQQPELRLATLPL